MMDEKEIFRLVYEKKISGAEALKQLELLNQKTEIGDTAAPGKTSGHDAHEIEKAVLGIVCATLRIPETDIRVEMSFKDIGVDSISGVEIVRDINTRFDINMDSADLYDFPNVRAMSKHVLELMESDSETIDTAEDAATDVFHDSYYQRLRKQYVRNEENAVRNEETDQAIFAAPSGGAKKLALRNLNGIKKK